MPAPTEGLTKTQRNRFNNICERVFRKVEQTFGNTIEDTLEMEPEEDGEIVFQSFLLRSRGVEYRVTVEAIRAGVAPSAVPE